ncbi:uncharacterized protein EV154DRAFT_465036 [Mucor mucedo]|uniref:uncharacterized protein n=1 Tax=Mucor mucedo TaxID=29922 RepID=UPI0022212540|nr:uncharacterized protein EV154DRAFT_465036 [Mucor mucedo]KAI7890781.1 hypothetical protein EV154DRAFT_465036 [Mucor mucedo]
MPYPILPAVSENSDEYTDVSKHVKSLQARLGLARFKMTQGWETSTLMDVEQMWKEKQQKMMKSFPTPRFTQRDIIDKRVYIPSPGARHAKAKKTKLVRTYSNPIQQQQQSKPALHLHPQKEHYHPMDSSSSSSEGEQAVRRRSITLHSPPHVRNSLDYLSYAIAMTENEPVIMSSQPLPDVTEIEPNLIDSLKVSTSTTPPKLSPPPSPVTLAAKAIMMFVNHPTQPAHNSH